MLRFCNAYAAVLQCSRCGFASLTLRFCKTFTQSEPKHSENAHLNFQERSLNLARGF